MHFLAFGGHSLLVGVAHHLLEIFWVDRVENVEEILSRWPLVLRILVREEGHHGRVLLELRIEILDRNLIVMRNLNLLNSALPQQLLFASQNILQEVLVDYILRWQIELQAVDETEYGQSEISSTKKSRKLRNALFENRRYVIIRAVRAGQHPGGLLLLSAWSI